MFNIYKLDNFEKESSNGKIGPTNELKDKSLFIN